MRRRTLPPSPRRRRPAGALLLLALASGGCGGALPRPAAPAPPGWPGTRAGDGLLTRPDLQAVVEAQARRETATLVSRLSHEDADVRARAAFALGSVQDPAAVPALLSTLRDPDARVRADAAFAVGQSADSAAAGALQAALEREPDPTVVGHLLEALGRTGGAQALARLATLAVPASHRAELALALARFGMRGVHAEPATRRILAMLEDGDPAVRAHAAYALARPADPAFWRPAAERVRRALDGLGPDDAAAPFLARALGRLEDPADAARLGTVLRDALDWRTRVSAARALAAVEDSTARGLLLDALDDASHHVRRAAAEALAGADSLPADEAARVAAWVARRPDPAASAALPALLRAGLEAEALAWRAALPADARILRLAALRALGTASGPASLAVLDSALRGPDAAVAAAAAQALAARWARMRTPERAPLFYPRFRDALVRADRAGAAAAAGALADTLFRPLGAAQLLEGARTELAGPAHAATRAAVERALAVLSGESPGSAGPSDAEPLRTSVDWLDLRRLGRHPLLVLETERGTVTLRLDAEQAPITVQTVAGLARAGRYDGVPFHRVVADFVIQGGDVERGDGTGGPGFSIPSELTRIPYRRGTLGMASAGKDTEGSQYFVAHSMQPHLDGAYTAFGVVVKGMDVVDRARLGDLVVRARVVPEGG